MTFLLQGPHAEDIGDPKTGRLEFLIPKIEMLFHKSTLDSIF